MIMRTIILAVTVAVSVSAQRLDFNQLQFSAKEKLVIETNQEALRSIKNLAKVYGQVCQDSISYKELKYYCENPSSNHYLFSIVKEMVEAYYAADRDLGKLMVDYYNPVLEMKRGNEERIKNERARKMKEKMAQYSETERAIARFQGKMPWEIDSKILSSWVRKAKENRERINKRHEEIIAKDLDSTKKEGVAIDNEMLR